MTGIRRDRNLKNILDYSAIKSQTQFSASDFKAGEDEDFVTALLESNAEFFAFVRPAFARAKRSLDPLVAKCYHPAMSQPVKLSDVLVLDARLTGEIAERSIAGQIEYWANLGRAIEPLLQGTQALALCKKASLRPLSECLESVDTPEGNRRVTKYLEAQPYPHYEPAKGSPGLLVRIEEGGKRTLGRFVNRQFQKVAKRK